jgi:hypothetical protein
MPPRWFTFTHHVYARHDDGERVAYGFLTGETWTLTEAAADLLQAVREGWQPGSEPPPALARHLTDGETAADLHQALTELAGDGLAVLAEEPPAVPAGALSTVRHAGLADLRIRLMRVGRLPERAASAVRGVLAATPVLVAVCVALGLWLLAGHAGAEATGAWSLFARRSGPAERLAVSMAALLVLLLVHEMGHAVAMCAVSGESVPVGVRLYYGFPQGYADVSSSILLPSRRQRVQVLLGGVAAEGLFWLALVAWMSLGTAPPLVYAAVRLGGALTVLWSLVPLRRNDGYFLLQELTGRRDLLEASREAAGAMLVRGATPVRWLAWYGMLRIHAAAAVVVVAGLGFATELSSAVPGAVAGLAAAAILASEYLPLLRSALRAQAVAAGPAA